MNTTADLLLLLIFLSALYTVLGLLSGLAEKARELSLRRHQQRWRLRRGARRRTPRRRAKTLRPGAWTPIPHLGPQQTKLVRTRRQSPAATAAG